MTADQRVAHYISGELIRAAEGDNDAAGVVERWFASGATKETVALGLVVYAQIAQTHGNAQGERAALEAAAVLADLEYLSGEPSIDEPCAFEGN